MSWTAENPELYDDLVLKGIISYIDTLLSESGFEPTGDWLDGYQALVETLREQGETRGVYDALVRLADESVQRSIANYYADKIDEVRSRRDDL